ncbi:MAG: DNA polymerase I [Rikenellaceae bacterium]|nr:DNA polymerase I [Rikenellaceae bacterium]
MKKLFLIDAYALIFRSYYAFISRPMRNADGLNTSAVFGFTKFLSEIIRRENPHYLGVAFDPAGGNFRSRLYPAYKANRSATPEDIIAAVPYIKRILEAMRIPVLEVPGYEADDVIGTLSAKASGMGFEVYMVTPDKDFGQLVTSSVSIYKQRKGGEGVEIIGPDEVKAHYGIDDPRQVIDILALWGDASDNIPGVPGVGEKGAMKLVGQYGSVENLLANVDKLSGKLRENVEASRDQILLSKQLATIHMEVPVECCPERLIMEEADYEALREVYRELGFHMFLRELDQLAGRRADAPAIGGNASVPVQPAPPAGAAPAPDQPARGRRPVTPGAAGSTQGSLFGAVAGDGEVSPAAVPAGDGQGDLFAASQYATAATTTHRYEIVDTLGGLDELVALLGRERVFCFDTETTGFDVFNDKLVGLSFCVRAHEAYYVPCNDANRAAVAGRLRPLFEDGSIAKIGQNIKFDIMVLRNLGIEVRGFKYDTMIVHYLLDPESRHGMDYLARTYLDYSPIAIEELIGRGARQITMDMVPVGRVAEYAAEDADVTFRLWERLWPMLEEAGLVELYTKIEEPLIEVLADIELTGVKIDTAALGAYGRELTLELDRIEDQVRVACGDPTLNVNSARQLGEALFDRLRIDPKPKKTKTRQYKTDEEYLRSLEDRHPVVGMILEYRGLKKLLSTYIEALPQLVNPKTGRIHTSFNQAVTATGRLSSTNPNLQNIPVREERGREIRKAFIPSDGDHLILSADYSQVELRLMAHLSGDAGLIEAFEQGEDIHTATASKLFGVPLPEVTRDQRRKAKTANFGIIYGISAFGLAQRLGIPRTEAREIIDGYFATYPGVKAYMERVVREAQQHGYVTTLFGRKRFLADINSGNSVTRGLAERNAINAPIQGSAADIMKMAMICVHREFKARGLRSRVILQVHDELVVDLYKPEQEVVADVVVRCMEGAAALRVALTVDYGVGENWIEAH